MGYLLNPLVEYLPFDLLSYPAAFVSPSSDYSYVRRAAAEVRRRMSLSSQVVEFDDIIEFFGEAHAVLIPVMRGNLRQHENALHVYLPDSRTTWVFINLDSKIMDFKFWMAHELAHVKAPEMPLYEAESFADRFAAELLFPVEIARSFVDSINATVEPGIVVTRVQNLAREFAISPVTVLEQLNLALDAKELPPIEVNIHPSTTNFHKSFRDVNEIVFGTERPTPSDYARICTEVFQTPIFDVLARYLRESGKEASYLQRVLNIGALDAKNLHKALTSDHGRKNPA
jgi:Zn-dependent peptidase ImmA (M78 family)